MTDARTSATVQYAACASGVFVGTTVGVAVAVTAGDAVGVALGDGVPAGSAVVGSGVVAADVVVLLVGVATATGMLHAALIASASTSPA